MAATTRLTRTSPPPRLFALDVDGTLTRPGLGVDGEVFSLLTRLSDLGVTIVVATGRGTFAAGEVTRRLPRTAYAVLNNGGIVRRIRDRNVLRARHLAHQAATSSLAVLKDHGMTAIWVESPFAAERYLCDGAWWDHPPTRRYLATKAPIVRPLRNTMAAAPPVEVFAFGDRDVVASAEHALNGQMSAGVSTVSWWSDRLEAAGLEALPPSVTQGEAVAWLAAELGIGASEALAIGDDRNDVEMLRWAGHGVAMNHAPSDVQAAADHVSEIQGPSAVPGLIRDVWGI